MQIICYIKPDECIAAIHVFHFDIHFALLPLCACLSCHRCLHHLLLQRVDCNSYINFFWGSHAILSPLFDRLFDT